jgi:molybdenum cofactor synthesis domain-containing protein
MTTLRFGILTVSDRSSRGERPDASGPVLAEAVAIKEWQIVETDIIPDDVETIRQKLIEWVNSSRFDVVLTTGGTGFAPRDVTPEATRLVVERLTPGLDEAMRSASLRVTPHAMLSRAISGIRKQTLIINLPGSPKAALENFQVVSPVLAHAVELLREDPGSEKGHLASNP